MGAQVMRLIDADELILRLETQDYSCAPDTLADWTPQDMTNAEIADIDRMPTVDAVPVVRCGKCIFFDFDESKDRWGICTRAMDIIISKDDYCSMGERKNDEHTD